MNVRYLVLCEHSEVAQGKHFISGGGMAAFAGFPQGEGGGPLMVPRFSIALCVVTPYAATNEVHRVSISLEDQDAAPLLPQPMETEFETGRPPGMRQNDEAFTCFSFSVQGLLAPRAGRYVATVEIDGSEEERQTFTIVNAFQTPARPAA